MPYCTPDDVRLVLVRDLADQQGTAAELSDATLLVTIAGAQALVDARLAGRYTVPFPDGHVPPLVTTITTDVAAWRATLTYRQGKDIAVDDPVRLRYTDAQTTLAALADGSMDLPMVTDPSTGSVTPAESGGATVRNPYRGRLFGADNFGLTSQRGGSCGW